MSVFVLLRGCPLPLVSMSPGSRGGPFLPQSESGGESGRRGGGGGGGGTGVSAAGLPGAGWGRRRGPRGDSAGPAAGSGVWAEELCLPLTVSV